MARFPAMAVVVIVACGGPQLTGPDGSTPDGATIDAPFDAPADAGDAAPPRGPARVYVGSSDGNIRIFSFDDTTSALAPVDTVATGGNPSFLAFDAARAYLYAVDEANSKVLAFAIDKTTGKLAALGGVSSLGQGPAYVGLDRSDSLVMVANYGDGTIATFPRQDGGTLADASTTHSFGATAHSHEIVADPSNAFVLVPNLGLDAVSLFKHTGLSLSYLGDTPAGTGPRHVAFDPSGAHAYVIDETASTITVFAFDAQLGKLTQIQSLSSLYGTFSGTNTGAEIQVTSDGKHVLASNRGDDSIVVFDVAGDGTLTAKARVATGGQTPRQFQIEETGRFLFVGNQNSGSVVVMKMDAQSGVPSPVGTPLSVPGPEFVGLVYLPP